MVKLRGRGIMARIVRLDVPGRCSFALDEVDTVYERLHAGEIKGRAVLQP